MRRGPQARRHIDATDGHRGVVTQVESEPRQRTAPDLPYLLRGLAITVPDQVWAMGIAYIPMAKS